ncbi:MAG: hypothetical protein M0006_03345 [Magnetospirillum sp.]|nr:hypothetical protein [Magnetospirillum sp.]
MTTTSETLALIQQALAAGGGAAPAEIMTKGWDQSASATSGITYYDLEPGAKKLYPVLTPLRNAIPRATGGKGIQANWRAITGVNTNNLDMGVSHGNRGGVIATSTQDYYAAFAGLGLEDFVNFEADYAAEGFDDVKALAMEGLLRAYMIGEEKVILGGQATYGIGQAAQPTVADVGTGGTLAYNTQYSVIVAGLTLAGYEASTVASGVRGSVSRTNIDTSVDTYGGGTGKLSANRLVQTANDANNTHALSCSVANLAGAVAYAWFWGAPGAEVLGAITTVNSLVITAAATGTQTAASLGANDNSNNNLVFDGLLAQAWKANSGSLIAYQATGAAGTGTPLTSDGVGGIVEFDADLQWFYDNHRMSPDTIWVSSQEQKNIKKKILNAGTAAAQRFVINTEQGNIKGGDLVASYLNPFGLNGAKAIPIKLHPNVPPGTIMYDTDTLPYPLNGVPALKRMRMRRDYYSLAWPVVKRRWEYGVYADGVLQHYAPFALGIRSNIGNG